MGVFAVIQMTSCLSVGANLIQAKSHILKAVDRGAELILLPEHFAYFPKKTSDFLNIAEVYGEGRIQKFLSEMARLSEVYIAGTVPIFTGGNHSEKFFHSLLLFSPEGLVVGRYDRQHLFNAEGSVSLGVLGLESLSVSPGASLGFPQVIHTRLGKIGLAIGFDLRFPRFFQELREQGAEIILLPSSCAYALADAHWHILVGARAIENQVFILGANQAGLHDNHQESYGESMILGPWGDVLNYQEHGVGPVLAEIDLLHLEVLREDFPVQSV